MPEKRFEFLNVDATMWRKGVTPISQLHPSDWETLEDTLQARKLEHMAQRLRDAGFHASTHRAVGGEWFFFSLISVSRPISHRGGAWFTLAEARQLLDTVANMEPYQAYARMERKLAPVEPDGPYTEDMARRDTREARERLAQRDVPATDFALEYQATSFMDLAE